MTLVNAFSETDDDATYAFPASFAQHRLWILDQLEPGRGTYNVPMQYTITGSLDERALVASLTQLVARHEALRTLFQQSDNGDVLQIVMPAQPLSLIIAEHFDATPEQIDAWCAREANAPFDLRIGPLIRAALLRTAPDAHVLSINVHHIAFDGWSMNILQRELRTLYDASVAEQEPYLPALSIQYADFTMWQRERMNTSLSASRLAYWTNQLRAPLPTLEIATDRPRSASREHTLGQAAICIDEATTRAVQQLAVSAGTTPFTVLLTVFQVLLQRHSGQDDIIVGTPMSGRASHDSESVIGCFVNTLALRGDLAGSPSFRVMLHRTRATMLAALEHDDVPFEQVVAAVRPDRVSGRNPIFQALFSLYAATDTLSLSGCDVASRAASLNTAKVDLQLLMQTTQTGFTGVLEFDCDLFDASTGARLAQHYTTLVNAAVANPDATIGDLTIMCDAERFTLLHEWNQTKRPYRADATVPQLIAERLAMTPDAVAVTDDARQLTYRELDARATSVAERLMQLGVGPDVIVALCVERSLSMLVGALGIWKAGGAYLALDPTYPPARLAHMLSDAVPQAIVADERSADRLPPHAIPLVLLDDTVAARSSSQPLCDGAGARAENLAYVVYTSGSTGTPKGVGVEHRALVNLLTSMTREPGFTSHDTLLAVTSLSFDIAALELWLPLITGGRVVIAPRSATVDGEGLARLIDASQATMLQATPATWRLLLAAGWTGRNDLTMLCGGEVLPAKLATALLPRGRALWNMYGPAETTVWSSAGRVTIDAPITLGRPIANTVMRVLDERGALLPIGVVGELYIGGVGLARGYVNDPERTALRFIADPHAVGHRLYRTGDRARWRADGTLEFLGRFDEQIKLRGHRVEVAEVERAVATHEDVEACAVVVRNIAADDERAEHGDTTQLVAYYVARQGALPSPDTLRTHVRRVLPSAMTPDAFVPINVLPVGPTGKVDRRALALFDAPVQRTARAYTHPRTTIEHDLVQIWERLFRVHPIDIHDDFFELGGHSLLAVQMLAEIERVRGRRLPLSTLFADTTIEGIARLLESAARADNEPPLVVLQDAARGRPFAFVHGDAGGGGWYCRRLAPLIGADVPLIVLGTLDPSSPGSPQSIAEVAATHVRALRVAQPNGPYRIGGYCIGGLVAFEMARQLCAAGQVVDRLIIVDAVAAAGIIPFQEYLVSMLARVMFRGEMQLERRTALLLRVQYYAGRVALIRRASGAQQMAWLGRILQRAWRRVAVGSHAYSDINPSVEDVAAAAFKAEMESRPGMRAFRAQLNFASAYVPRAYPGRVDLVVSDALRECPDVQSIYGWKRVSDVRMHDVSASHFGIVTTELPLLAAIIRTCLTE